MKVTLWLGEKFVKGAQVADEALVSITPMQSVKEAEEISHSTAVVKVQTTYTCTVTLDI